MSAEGAITSERAPGPKVVELTDFDVGDFPIVEGVVTDEHGEPYNTIELPEKLRKLFDEQGAAIVRVNSAELAAKLPDYGGRASGDYSLLPHQDHVDPEHDRRRFLMLSKLDEGTRGSATIAMTPEAARALLSVTEAYFRQHRLEIAAERHYDQRFIISEAQYNQCLDSDEGLDEVVREIVGDDASPLRVLRVRSGILGFLVRGSYADDLVQDELFERLVTDMPGQMAIENWEQPGVLIIDNAVVFHMRCGGNNPPLKRNFATVAGS